MPNNPQFTTIDLATTGRTTVYDPDYQASMTGVFLGNPTDDAHVILEVTSNGETVPIADPGLGQDLAFDHNVTLEGIATIQINVIKATADTITTDAVVFPGG